MRREGMTSRKIRKIRVYCIQPEASTGTVAERNKVYHKDYGSYKEAAKAEHTIPAVIEAMCKTGIGIDDNTVFAFELEEMESWQ